MFIYTHMLSTSMNPVNCAFARNMLALPSSLQKSFKNTGER